MSRLITFYQPQAPTLEGSGRFPLLRIAWETSWRQFERLTCWVLQYPFTVGTNQRIVESLGYSPGTQAMVLLGEKGPRNGLHHPYRRSIIHRFHFLHTLELFYRNYWFLNYWKSLAEWVLPLPLLLSTFPQIVLRTVNHFCLFIFNKPPCAIPISSWRVAGFVWACLDRWWRCGAVSLENDGARGGGGLPSECTYV